MRQRPCTPRSPICRSNVRRARLRYAISLSLLSSVYSCGPSLVGAGVLRSRSVSCAVRPCCRCRSLPVLPLSLPFTGNVNYTNGNINNVGSNGNWWSSTANSNTNARNLNFNSGNFNPQNNNNKGNGFAVRCVAQ